MDRFEDDDRISAYLDGELTADEQSQFEERLAESAELRQLVEELRALRGSLDLLPRHRLEEDFAERVLRQAEREVLTAGQPPSNGTAANTLTAPEPNLDDRPSPAVESARPTRRSRRPLIYVAATIAAAVLIMVVDHMRPGNPEVAQVTPRRDATDSKRELSPDILAAADKRKVDKDRSPSEEKSLQSSGFTAHSALQGSEGGGQQAQKNLAEVADKPAKDSKDSDGAQRRGNLATETRGLQDADKTTKGTSAFKTPAVQSAVEGSGPQDAPAGAIAASAGKAADGAKGDSAKSDTDPAAGRKLDKSSPFGSGVADEGLVAKDQSPPGKSGAPVGGREGRVGRPEAQVLDDRFATRKETLRQAATDGRLLVARYAVANASAETRFNQLLVEHKFAIETDDNRSLGGYAAAKNGSVVAGGGASPAEGRTRWNVQPERLFEAEQITAGDKTGAESDGLGRQCDAFYVEGTAEQVLGLIDAVEHEKSVFQPVPLGEPPNNSPANTFAYQLPVTDAEINGATTLPLGSPAPREPNLSQTEHGKSERAVEMPDDKLAAPAATQLNKGGARPSESAAQTKQAGGDQPATQNPAKSSKAHSADDFAKELAPKYRRTTPVEEQAKSVGHAPDPSAPEPPVPVLREKVAGQPPKPEKQSEVGDLDAVKQSEGTNLGRDLSRTTSFAVRLPSVEFGPAAVSGKPADTENMKRASGGAGFESAEKKAANGQSDSVRLKAFGAARGESAAPTAGGAPATQPATAEQLGIEPTDAKSNGRGRAGGNEADAKTPASENKNEAHFYANLNRSYWGDGTTAGPARMSAVFIFRSGPQPAAAASPAASPAGPPHPAAPAKK